MSMVYLELKGISKSFPGVKANDHISLEIEKGEVLAVVGENGAGKTTLMNILYGFYQPDEGEIWIDGRLASIHSPSDAIALKIGMVHQHFTLVPVFTVAENIVLGAEPTRFKAVLDFKGAVKKARELSQRFGLNVDPTAVVESIPVGQQQRVEILKTLYRGAETLILDEPTSVLTPQETQELFKTIKMLSSEGKTILFVSHKLKEVLSIADRIAVLRNGKVRGVVKVKETNERELAKLMVGRDVVLEVKKSPPLVGEVLLETKGLKALNSKGLLALKGVSLQLRAGEILGIAGVEGNGQTELVEALTGLRKLEAGEIWIKRNRLKKYNPGEVRQKGLGHIPEDRQKRGLVLPFTVAYNLILGRQTQTPFSRRGWLSFAQIDTSAEERISLFDIRPPRKNVEAKNLSGGNQQKVILARELSFAPPIIIAAQPTRGLDVGATEFVYERLLKARAEGTAILLVSLDLEEIMSLSDRIIVLYEGEIRGELDASQATEEELGLLMLGVKRTDEVKA
ncbi:simple sugar transport system ATP-binding protein [Candidatus Hakubella thermalkaliphila]|uniref:Simple sugar transport system ATP-binding protein n=1 Tax=Candidatus Hakubella thermalkaliphila TaxID=2754717 RepID=A0A6V8NWP3_9ACTN|nr:simple sugar transport system ATP-binding protein [Candidatus Hakubella thermalkaliphila]